MIVISIMYVYEKGRRFDFDYYVNQHIPGVKKYVGDEIFSLLKEIKVTKGLSGGLPDTPPAFFAQTQLFFDTIEDFQKYAQASKDRPSDLDKYSDHHAVFTISEVKHGQFF